MIIYMAARFHWEYGVGGVVALVHDVLVTVGVCCLMGRQISMNVVAALLTIVGYSINDTIVIYDRIREVLKLYRGRGLSFPEVADLSINQTLSRTILTSGATLFAVLALFIFGGRVINDFAFALIVGMVSGCYSTIYIATPIVHILQRFKERRALHLGGRKKGEDSARRRLPQDRRSSKQVTA